jgi:hypothetical protein
MQGFIITPLAMPAGHLSVGIHCDCGQMMMINPKNSERSQFQTITLTGQPVLLNCCNGPAKYEIHPRDTHIEVVVS